MEPLSLRAHHINSAKLLFRTPREQVIEAMKRFRYIKNASDSFVNIVYYNLQKYFQKLSNKLKLTVGGLDIICENCLKNQNGICHQEDRREYNIFLGVNSFEESADVQILDKYGLKVDKIYTIREIRKVANF